MLNANKTTTAVIPDSTPSDLFYERGIDDLGRIVLPQDYRRVLGIGERDTLCIYLDREHQAMVLKKAAADPPEG